MMDIQAKARSKPVTKSEAVQQDNEYKVTL